jgi:competence protein ComEC
LIAAKQRQGFPGIEKLGKFADFLFAVGLPAQDNPDMNERGWVSAAIPHGPEAERRARQNDWAAPLLPVASCWTIGIILDRYFQLPISFSFLVALLGLVSWLLACLGQASGGRLPFLLVSCAALGATYHHVRQHYYFANDIGAFASSVTRPIQARGSLDEEPVLVQPVREPELQSIEPQPSTNCVLRLHSVRRDDEWVTVSGRAQLTVQGILHDLHAGDEVEIVGRINAPEGPSNPGEFDYEAYLRDQRIRAVIRVAKTSAGVTRLEQGSWRAPAAWLAMIRGWGQRTLQEYVSLNQSGLASALLFGESSEMTNADWDQYMRTGVIHVLAISGQHLVVLAAFLWWTLPFLHMSRRRATWLVTSLLVFYAFVAGGRPPVLRSAVTVFICCVGFYWHRPILLGNALALAWLVVSVWNPADLATPGCQLSFLAVAVIYWGIARWPIGSRDPLERLLEDTLPPWRRYLRSLGALILASYLVSIPIWLAAAPLVAAHYHVASPVGLLIGPPLTFLCAIALILGFLLLLAATIWAPLATILGGLVGVCLACCELLVRLAAKVPGAYWYVADVPTWWLWCFYVGLFAALTVDYVRKRWRLAIAAGLTWICLGLMVGAFRWPSDELRCTFLAVGHGGCTVIETADGRTMLYDAGAISGPEVTRRSIAPFLWHRGLRRIDEVFLSHADLDHFNGLPALLDRFSVGQVTCTPTFSSKRTEGVGRTLDALAAWHIPVRVVHAGDRLRAGALEIEVLHPPATGPEGNENARSLVLFLRHLGHTILLTGDLEGAGLERVLSMPPKELDVLMAPHHGSRVSNRADLAAWAHPRIVVSCEGKPRGPTRPPEPYSSLGAKFLGTWPYGAVTIRSHTTGLVVETYREKEPFVIRRALP